MEENREMNLLSLINMSLEFVYGSAALSNHDLIRLKRFISQSEGYRMSFVSYSYVGVVWFQRLNFSTCHIKENLSI